MFQRFNPNQPVCAPVPVWAWMLVRLRQGRDAILKNRKRFCRSGKKILTRGWSGNQGNFFFQKSKARNERAKAEGIATTAGRKASCSKLACAVLITREKLPLGSSWHTRLSPELFSSSTEQLFWEQMRKFIYRIGTEQPPGPQGRSNVRISVKENLPLLRKVQLSAADVIQDDSLIKVLET